MERGTIEVAPLAFMRGRTLNDSFIILDEAQNTTPEQMQMFLTRLGFGSKVVVTGDVTQVDLPREQASGPDPGAGHPRLDRRASSSSASGTRTSCGTSSCSGSSRRTSCTRRRPAPSGGSSDDGRDRGREPSGAAASTSRRGVELIRARAAATRAIEDGELGLALVGREEIRDAEARASRHRRGDRRRSRSRSTAATTLPDGVPRAARRRRPLPAGRRRRVARRRSCTPCCTCVGYDHGARDGSAGAGSRMRARAARSSRLQLRDRGRSSTCCGRSATCASTSRSPSP